MKIKTYISAEIIQRSLTNTPQITFEITDACNFDCVYCGYGKLYLDYDNRENKAIKEFIENYNQDWILHRLKCFSPVEYRKKHEENAA